jgi:hypothetical protein
MFLEGSIAAPPTIGSPPMLDICAQASPVEASSNDVVSKALVIFMVFAFPNHAAVRGTLPCVKSLKAGSGLFGK